MLNKNGADGVFLINHNVDTRMLLDIYKDINDLFSDYWIGLNCLGLGLKAVSMIPQRTAGLWSDDAGIEEGADNPALAAQVFKEERERNGWRGLCFGGVAFKHQRPVRNVSAVAKLATAFIDVITTSGPATGQAANPRKIQLMKEAIGDHPLAVASGIAPENVSDYTPWADCFLVATGISHSFTELDPKKVGQLAQKLSG